MPRLGHEYKRLVDIAGAESLWCVQCFFFSSGMGDLALFNAWVKSSGSKTVAGIEKGCSLMVAVSALISVVICDGYLLLLGLAFVVGFVFTGG